MRGVAESRKQKAGGKKQKVESMRPELANNKFRKSARSYDNIK